MAKVHLLLPCTHCQGQAYLPAGQATSCQGEAYTRYQPCPVFARVAVSSPNGSAWRSSTSCCKTAVRSP